MTGDFIKVTGKKKKPSPFADGLTLEDIRDMDDWVGLNGGILFNVEKNYMGRKAIFTLMLEEGQTRPEIVGSNSPKVFGTDRMKFVPLDTQPTMDFMKEKTSFKEAFELLHVQYNEYLYLLDTHYYDLMIFGAMSTYFREIFYTYAYFDFYAAEFNCGKTTAMKCLIWASFYGFLPLDPTGPVLFRAIDGCHSAVGIDELDNVIQDENGRANIIGLLNAAYQKGTPAYRVDMEKGGEIVPYDPFGMKAYTHTAPLPQSFKSRSILIKMVRTPDTKEQLKEPAEFMDFRNMMYKLRMTKKAEVEIAYDFVLKDCGLRNRDRDRFAPILTMAYLKSKTTYKKLVKWAIEYVKEDESSGVDEARRALIEILATWKAGVYTLVSIRKAWNTMLQERELASRDFSSRFVTRTLESFGFNKSAYRAGNRTHFDISKKMLTEWERIYQIAPSEIVGALNLPNLLNQDPEEQSTECTQTTDGSNLTHFTEPKKEVKEVKLVKSQTAHLTKVQKFLVGHGAGSGFSPSANEQESEVFFVAVEKGLIEEESVGMWQLTEKGRKHIEGLH